MLLRISSVIVTKSEGNCSHFYWRNPQWKTSFFVQFTCRKKKEVACRFNAPWAPSNKTRIIRSEEKIDETIVN